MNTLKEFLDDKMLVIICVTILGIVSLITMGTGAESIVNQINAGMFGVAVGKTIR